MGMSDWEPVSGHNAAIAASWMETGSQRLSGKLEWLQERPDEFRETPERQATLATLTEVIRREPKLDPLAPQMFSHVTEQHLHREPDWTGWTGYSATDYLEDNRYRKRVTSDWTEVTA